jgi:hypothetical protein
MSSHHIIEPNQINRLHLNHFSPIYEFYHQKLKVNSVIAARESTKQYIVSSVFSAFEDQLTAAEFLYMNDYFDELNQFIETTPYHQDIKKLYRIVLDRKKTSLTHKDLDEIKDLSFTHPSLKCMHLFLLVYAHYDIRKYAKMDNYSEDILEVMYTINEPLFHYYMRLRFDEVTFHHYWKTNHMILAKKFAYKYINSGLAPRKQLAMNHHLSLCHVFEDYETSMHYVNVALKLAEEHQFSKSIKTINNQTIPFISSFHGKTENVKTSDPVETAHQAILKGDNTKAIRILSSIQSPTPYQDSYLGLAKKDLQLLRKAKDRFINDYRDLFFAQLPEYYMKRIIKAL